MRTNDLIKEYRQASKTPKTYAEAASELAVLLGAIAKALKGGEKVPLQGIGALEANIQHMRERSFHDVQTGEMQTRPAHKTVRAKFKFSKKFKEQLLQSN